MAIKKATLVLEGGATRGVFTSGVLDFLMERELYLSHVIGVSAVFFVLTLSDILSEISYLTWGIRSGHPLMSPFKIAVNIRCFAPGCSAFN